VILSDYHLLANVQKDTLMTELKNASNVHLNARHVTNMDVPNVFQKDNNHHQNVLASKDRSKLTENAFHAHINVLLAKRLQKTAKNAKLTELTHHIVLAQKELSMTV
jgi:hypothetical protein